MVRESALEAIIRKEMLHGVHAERLSFPRRGTKIFEAGAPASALFFLDSGLIKLERSSNGRLLLLGMLGGGEIFGEQAFLDNGIYICSAVVAQPAIVFRMLAERVMEFCNQRTAVWRLICNEVIQRSVALSLRIEHLCLSEVQWRVLFSLAELAQLSRDPYSSSALVQISQTELAGMVGASRETVSAALNRLARTGLLQIGHRTIRIPSLGALEEALQSRPKAK
jgi:CRP/FNR family transcriptional regulator